MYTNNLYHSFQPYSYNDQPNILKYTPPPIIHNAETVHIPSETLIPFSTIQTLNNDAILRNYKYTNNELLSYLIPPKNSPHSNIPSLLRNNYYTKHHTHTKRINRKWNVIRSCIHMISLYKVLNTYSHHKHLIKKSKYDNFIKTANDLMQLRDYMLQLLPNIQKFCVKYFTKPLLYGDTTSLSEKEETVIIVKAFLHLMLTEFTCAFSDRTIIPIYIRLLFREYLQEGTQLPFGFLSTFEFNRLEFGFDLKLKNLNLNRQAMIACMILFYRVLLGDILRQPFKYFGRLANASKGRDRNINLFRYNRQRGDNGNRVIFNNERYEPRKQRQRQRYTPKDGGKRGYDVRREHPPPPPPPKNNNKQRQPQQQQQQQQPFRVVNENILTNLHDDISTNNYDKKTQMKGRHLPPLKRVGFNDIINNSGITSSVGVNRSMKDCLYNNNFNLRSLEQDDKDNLAGIIEHNVHFITNILDYIIISSIKDNVPIYNEQYKESFCYGVMVYRKTNITYQHDVDMNELQHGVVCDKDKTIPFITENKGLLEMYKQCFFLLCKDFVKRCQEI